MTSRHTYGTVRPYASQQPSTIPITVMMSLFTLTHQMEHEQWQQFKNEKRKRALATE